MAGPAAEDTALEPRAGEDEEPAALPPLVAVVITAGGKGLERVLRDLDAQSYDALTVLVIDRTGEPDDAAIPERIAAVAPRALVRRLPEPTGAPGAANDVLETVRGAPFLL